MIEQELRERIEGVLDDDTQPDWPDVVAREAAPDPGSADPGGAPLHGTSRRGLRWRRAVPARTRSLAAAAVVGAAIASAPALAFSPTVRELVGLTRSKPPELQATITHVTVHHRAIGATITATFTIGETGKRPGTGVPAGSEFLVLVVPKHGAPNPNLIKAEGANGHYRFTAWVPRSGIGSIQVGGWLDRVATPTAAGGFWLPVTIVNSSF